jgi:hypothetical protein
VGGLPIHQSQRGNELRHLWRIWRDTAFAKQDEDARRLGHLRLRRLERNGSCRGEGKPSSTAAICQHGFGSASIDDRRQATLLGISKRGNKYLGKLLIHGALPHIEERDTALGRCARGH